VTKVAKPLKVDVPVAMDVCSTSGGPPAASHDVVVLNDFQTDNGSRGRSVKRRSTGENGTPVGSPHSAHDILRAINQFDAAQLQALQQAMTLANQQQAEAHANAHAHAQQHAQAQAQAHAQQQAQAIAQQQAALQAQQQALAQQQSQAQAQAQAQAQLEAQAQQPFMYEVDPNAAANGAGDDDDIDDDGDCEDNDGDDDDDISTLYDEITVHSQSPAGRSTSSFDFGQGSGLDQLAFASSLQQAAAFGGGSPSL